MKGLILGFQSDNWKKSACVRAAWFIGRIVIACSEHTRILPSPLYTTNYYKKISSHGFYCSFSLSVSWQTYKTMSHGVDAKSGLFSHWTWSATFVTAQFG